MSFDNRLPADQIASLEPGDRVTFSASVGAFARTELQNGKVVRLTPKQIVVHYNASGRTIECRFRKDDGGKVGEGYGYLLDPTHPSTIDRATQAQRQRRRQVIDALADRWARERDNLDLLRRLQVAIGEYLDAES